MSDGTGTNTYSYNAVYTGGSPITGGGRLAGVSVPIAGSSATVAYTYDALGRAYQRTIDSANPVTTLFDTLGRVTHVTNALCPSSSNNFTYAYVNTPEPSYRLASVTYPSGTGLSTTYSYYGNTG